MNSTLSALRLLRFPLAALILTAQLAPRARAQAYSEPDRGQPGDEMIQLYLRQETLKLEAELEPAKTAADWAKLRPQYRAEYLDMLGLADASSLSRDPGAPLERTPLHAKITRSLDRGDYQVDMLHFQSRPGLYVTANLFRPSGIPAGARLPAIVYVCGHSPRGRNGNKTAYQSHGAWFARHGYICIVLDTLQMGEIAGIHHGTYRENRWWWISRGYTSAGVEAWNGVRAVDYLVSRPDVDPGRIGVTGISGGGAATFWIAAADERVSVAVPVSGMADLTSYIPNRVINGHCDCMFLHNTFQWPWTRIATLIAPRPLLFVNSDADPIFPMDANDRVINRLERFYSLFGASDRVDAVVSIGGHAYREDIRQAAYRFLNSWLKHEPQLLSDSEVDLVTGSRNEEHPIPPESLRVFPSDADIPTDAANDRIDELFVPIAPPAALGPGNFTNWRDATLARLRRLSFNHFPARIPAGIPAQMPVPGAEPLGHELIRLSTEPPIVVALKPGRAPAQPERILLAVTGTSLNDPLPDWISQLAAERTTLYVLEPRGVGATQWTQKNPPNYVQRSHLLLGRTADSGRIWDIVAAARFLRTLHPEVPIHLAGESAAGALCVYAAALESDVAALHLRHLPASHMEPGAPVLLNVLRVVDLPSSIGLVAPRPVTLSASPDAFQTITRNLYKAAGAPDNLKFLD